MNNENNKHIKNLNDEKENFKEKNKYLKKKIKDLEDGYNKIININHIDNKDKNIILNHD